MKSILLLAFLSLLTLAPIAARADGQMVSSVDRVSIQVKVNTTDDHKDLAKTSTDETIQHKTLDISLTGKARPDDTRVVKWAVYARNVKNNAIRAVGSGEIKLALNAGGSANAQSKEVSCSYTPEHDVVNNDKVTNNGKTKNQIRVKRVEAKGEKYVGYSVKVLDGAQVVGQAADPQGIEEDKK